MARTPLEPWKDVRDRGSSRLWVWIIAPGNRDIFSVFLNMKVFCVLSLPHLVEVILMSKHNIFSKGLKSEFERAVVNETSVFEPLKFYCI